MTRIEFVCDKCESIVSAEYVLFDGEGNVLLTDANGHKTIYTGMTRRPSSS